MENVTRIVPLLLLFAFVGKIVAMGNAGMADASIALGLAAVICVQEFRFFKKQQEDYDHKLKELNDSYSKKYEELKEKTDEINDIKSYITAIKSTSQIKNSQTGTFTTSSAKEFKF